MAWGAKPGMDMESHKKEGHGPSLTVAGKRSGLDENKPRKRAFRASE